MEIRLLSARARHEVQDTWQQVEAHVDGGGLTCSWAWTETWLNAYGDAVPHQFAVGVRQGTPCAMALVTRQTERIKGILPIRTLHLGTAGEPAGSGVWVEYNRLLVRDEDRASFARGLMETIRGLRGWDELRLDGFAADDARALASQEPRLVVQRAVCPTVDLGRAAAHGGDVLSMLRSGVQRKVRQSLRVAGPLEASFAATVEEALEIFNELVTLHQRRWTASGQPGAFAHPRTVQFHRALIPRLFLRDAALLFRVRTSERTLGCLYHFVERGNVLFYQSGVAEFPDNRIRPGYLLHALCMQACYERAWQDYNFLEGDSGYKREFATVERELVWATARRRTPRSTALATAGWARRRWVEARRRA